MELLETTKSIQFNTLLCSLANQAEYGIELVVEKHDFSAQTEEYLKKGIHFCELLKESSEIAESEKVTFNQLDLISIVEPLKAAGDAKYKKMIGGIDHAIQTLNSLLEKTPITREEADSLEDFLRDASETYRMIASNALSSMLRRGSFISL